MESLLAVDLGVRTGLALYNDEGRLLWYRSRNLGQASRLKRAAPGIVRAIPDLSWLVLEGGGPLADIWIHAVAHRSVQVRCIAAEQWRRRLFNLRDHRNTRDAKSRADTLARRVIHACGAAKPTSLRHDAAEAVLVGLWGLLEVGWLAQLPAELQPH